MLEFSVSPVLIWLLIGIAFFAVEMAIPGFIVFFFGVGAWCVSCTVWLVDLSLSTQLIVFLLTSIVTLVLFRKLLTGVFTGEKKEETDSVTYNPSPATGTVVEPITPPAEGKVKYAGTYWRAVADEAIQSDTTVEVVDQNDLIIKVRPMGSQSQGE